MAYNITLRLERSEYNRKRCNKGVNSNYVDVADFQFKAPFDETNPIIIINYPKLNIGVVQLNNFNYCTLTFGDGTNNVVKKYFITHRTYLTNELMQIDMHIDVLTTYYDYYKTGSFYIERSTSDYNPMLEDSYVSFNEQQQVTTIPISVLYNNICYDSPVAFLMTTSGSNLTLRTATEKTINAFGNSIRMYDNKPQVLFTDELVRHFISKIRNEADFASSVRAFFYLPVKDSYFDTSVEDKTEIAKDIALNEDNTVFFNSKSSTMSSIANALFDTRYTPNTYIITDTSPSMQLYQLVGGPVYTIELMMFEIGLPLSALDFISASHSRYILRLPIINEIEIDIQEYIHYSTIRMCMVVNMFDGTSIIQLIGDDNILYSSDVSAAFKIDTSTTNAQQIKDDLKRLGTQTILATLTGGLSSALAVGGGNKEKALNSGVGVASTLINTSVSEATMRTRALVQNVQNDISKFSSSITPKLFKYTHLNNNGILNINEIGKPLYAWRTFNTLSGFIKCGGVMKDLIIPCTDDEYNELIGLLKEGVYNE